MLVHVADSMERVRAIEALEAMAAAEGSGFSESQPGFGPMRTGDWLRWAQRHLDHHLKQFDVGARAREVAALSVTWTYS